MPLVSVPRAVAAVLLLAVAATAAAERPKPTVNASMTWDEIRTINRFDSEVAKAASELGMEAPNVVFFPLMGKVPFKVSRTKVAFVLPGYHTIVMTRVAARISETQLRCAARHEVLHFYLGHTNGSHSVEEMDAKHAEVAAAQLARWGEESSCGL